MLFLKLCVKLLLIASVVHSAEWTEPFFEDAGSSPIINFTISESLQYSLNIWEEQTETKALIITYNGEPEDITITSSYGDFYANYDKRLEKNDHGSIDFFIQKSPDYETMRFTDTLTQIQISISGSPPKDVGIYVINIDDNIPIIVSSQGSCSVEENFQGVISDCQFEVTDYDGCASTIDTVDLNPKIRLTPTGNPSEAYPQCLSSARLTTTYPFALETTTALDFEEGGSFILKITVEDGGHNIANEIQVTIVIIDVNDMIPIWVKIPSTFSINEQTKGEIEISARDGDIGINAPICFTMTTEDGITDEEKAYFEIEDETQGIITIHAIDRDKWQSTSYTLSVTAFECSDTDSRSELREIIVLVQDENNNAPKITVINGDSSEIYPDPLTIDENSANQLQYQINVYDPDEGNGGTFKVEIQGDPYKDAFVIIPSQAYKNGSFSINVKNSTLLDYENDDWKSFKIDIVVTEVANELHTDRISITINLRNINDNPPVLDKDLTVSVKENIKQGDLLKQIRATDADGDELSFGIRAYPDLHMDASTGIISLDKDNVFDYEQQTTVSVQITATDGSFTAYDTLTVNLIDVDDTTPTMSLNVSSVDVYELAEIGNEIPVTITMSDQDTEPNLECSINWDETKAFKNSVLLENLDDLIDKITPTTPTSQITTLTTTLTTTLKIQGPIEWSTVDRIQLVIKVTDTNTEEGEGSTSANLIVNINDINNNHPEFDTGTCTVARTMMENSVENQTISNPVKATDADGSPYNTVFYSIDPLDERISIDINTGQLTVGTKKVDFEVDEQIKFDVVVQDGVEDPFSGTATCQITITIQDVNDCIPEAVPDADIVEVYENESEWFLTNIVGYDNDTSESFHTVNFSIGNSDMTNYFMIQGTESDSTVEFWVKLQNDYVLDYETRQSYAVPIIVKDNPNDPGGIQLSSTTTITVNIKDVNDNDPIFQNAGSPECFFTKDETIPAGIQLSDADIIATDKDSGDNSRISYSIDSIDCDLDTVKNCPNNLLDLFEIRENSDTNGQNVARVFSKKGLLGYYGNFNAQILAQDHGEPSRSSIGAYKFCIIDINDNTPVIVYPDGNALFIKQVNENLVQNNGEPIPLFFATDADFNENGHVKFTIELTNGENYFQVKNNDNNTAQLLLADGIEFNKLPESININVRACDSPSENPLCANTVLTVNTIVDKEVEPKFDMPLFSNEFTENSTTESVQIPEATDRNNDDPNVPPQNIYYYIIDGNEDNYFKLDKTNRELSLNKPLDASVDDLYSLIIQTSNTDINNNPLPEPEEGSTLIVNITVKDINDKWPIFDQPQVTISVTSAQNGQNVLTLNATDLDKLDEITYSIDYNSLDNQLGVDIDETNILKIDDPIRGNIKINYPIQATQGYLKFEAIATDLENHLGYQIIIIYIVSEKYRIRFSFLNTRQQVVNNQQQVVDTFSDFFHNECINGDVSDTNDRGITNLTVHFIDDSGKPVDLSTIAPILNNVESINELRNNLSQSFQLNLIAAGDGQAPIKDSQVLENALIGVSVALGVLLIGAIVLYVIRIRHLSALVKNLTKANVQDTEKDIHMALPNTNLHANIGSNPVWNTDITSKDLDTVSTSTANSDDSGLIGIEDNPEFDAFYKDVLAKSEAAKEMDANYEPHHIPGLDFNDNSNANIF